MIAARESRCRHERSGWASITNATRPKATRRMGDPMMWPIAGKIAQPQSILFIPRVVVFLIAATLPSRLPGPLPLWFVGLIFGIVIVVWNERSAKTAFTLTNAAFLGASTLIWILVLWILFRAANV